MSRQHQRPWAGDDGFSLIELLVVIIIMGILAGIAVPIFLNQRARAHDASAKADLRNLANFEEIYFVDYGGYADIATIVAKEPRVSASSGVTLSVVRYDTDLGYCLAAVHAASGRTWYWDSQAGGLQPLGAASCPTTTSGTAGDSLTG